MSLYVTLLSTNQRARNYPTQIRYTESTESKQALLYEEALAKTVCFTCLRAREKSEQAQFGGPHSEVQVELD